MSPRFRPTFSELTFLGAFGLVVCRIVVYASVSWWILWEVRGTTSYGIVVSVIFYGAYVVELVRLLLRVPVAAYHIATGLPLTTGIGVPTDATVFLDKAITTGRVHSLLSSLDLITLGFIVLVAVGFNASILRVRWGQAFLAASTPWAAWTLIKLVITGGRFEFLAGF